MIEKEVDKSTSVKKYLIILIIVFVILTFGKGFLFGFWEAGPEKPEKILTCGDGSFYETCSLTKPYFCEEGVLVEKASLCGCVEGLTKKGDSCVSKYQTNLKEISLKYVLRGEKGEISYTVYQGMVEYLSNLSKTIYYEDKEMPSRADFKLKNINEEEQKKLLLPLVAKIQNLAETEEDQVRIAISLVQNIPFGASEKTIKIGDNLETNYSRYPYEVLYDEQGVCGEKVELLAFLLREMGYGLAFFYHASENHESLGIKCPVEHSLGNTGYCFVETTGPSIMTDDSIDYVGGIRLTSEPEVYLISYGASLSEDMYEYKDAKTMSRLNKKIIEKGELNWFEHRKLEKLREKYNLIEEYKSG